MNTEEIKEKSEFISRVAEQDYLESVVSGIHPQVAIKKLEEVNQFLTNMASALPMTRLQRVVERMRHNKDRQREAVRDETEPPHKRAKRDEEYSETSDD